MTVAHSERYLATSDHADELLGFEIFGGLDDRERAVVALQALERVVVTRRPAHVERRALQVSQGGHRGIPRPAHDHLIDEEIWLTECHVRAALLGDRERGCNDVATAFQEPRDQLVTGRWHNHRQTHVEILGDELRQLEVEAHRPTSVKIIGHWIVAGEHPQHAPFPDALEIAKEAFIGMSGQGLLDEEGVGGCQQLWVLPADGPGDLASLGDLEQRLNGVGIRLDSIEGVAIDDGERSLALCHFIDDRLGVQMLFYEDHLERGDVRALQRFQGLRERRARPDVDLTSRERYRRSRKVLGAPLSNDPFLNSCCWSRERNLLLSLVGDRELSGHEIALPLHQHRDELVAAVDEDELHVDAQAPGELFRQGLVQGCWHPLPRKKLLFAACAHQHAERASRSDAREIALVNDRRHRLPSSFLDVRRRLTGPSSTARPDTPRHAAPTMVAPLPL